MAILRKSPLLVIAQAVRRRCLSALSVVLCWVRLLTFSLGTGESSGVWAESAVVSRLGSGVACSVLAVGVASVLCVVGRYVDVVCASSQAV